MRLHVSVAATCCLLATYPACAQTSSLRVELPATGPAPRHLAGPVAGATAMSPAPGAEPDSAAALRHLFARYRARRWRVLAGTVLVGTGLTVASAVSVKRANDPLAAGFAGLGAILAGTVTAVLVPVESVALVRVSRRHERQAIGQWQAHHLPAQVRNAL